MEESNTPIGNACGATIRVVYHKNLKIIPMLIPLPAKSSKASHKACITNTNRMIKKVARNGIKKLFNIYLSSFFTNTKVMSLIIINTKVLLIAKQAINKTL